MPSAGAVTPLGLVLEPYSNLETIAMKTNVGPLDRGVRLLLASVFFYLGLFLYGGSALGIALSVAGGVLLVTGLVGFCGLYSLLGLHTNQSQAPQ